MSYSFDQIEQIWKDAGGNPAYAAMAAAVAMAESGGNPNSTNNNSNGTVDRGLWQINSIHGSQSTYDVQANARAAVSISSNGTNWKPWCSAWSNNACGGTFLGAGAHVLKYLPTGASTGGTGVSGEASQGQQSTGDSATTTVGNPLDPNSWAQVITSAVMRPIALWAWYGLMTLAGGAMVAAGVWLMVKDSAIVTAAKQKLSQTEDVGLSAVPGGQVVVAAKTAQAQKKTAAKQPPSSPVKKAAPKKATRAKEYTPKHSTDYQGRHRGGDSGGTPSTT